MIHFINMHEGTSYKACTFCKVDITISDLFYGQYFDSIFLKLVIINDLEHLGTILGKVSYKIGLFIVYYLFWMILVFHALLLLLEIFSSIWPAAKSESSWMGHKEGKIWSWASTFCKTPKHQPEGMAGAFWTTNYFPSESLGVKHLFLQVRKSSSVVHLQKA